MNEKIWEVVLEKTTRTTMTVDAKNYLDAVSKAKSGYANIHDNDVIEEKWEADEIESD